MTISRTTRQPKSNEFKERGLCAPPPLSNATIVWREVWREASSHSTQTEPVGQQQQQQQQRHPNARERREARDKLARRQSQSEHFPDATAYAYFKGWPLEYRLTITWGACIHGEKHEGHILGLPDKDRHERLRSELARHLRNAGYPLACVWARDEGAKHGLHTHLALYWPLPAAQLVKLLSRLTGSPPAQGRMPFDVVAQSECKGWQIKQNMDRHRLQSAQRWADYLVTQGPRHLNVPRLDGKVLGVSRAISPSAVEAQKTALEAWKHRVGW